RHGDRDLHRGQRERGQPHPGRRVRAADLIAYGGALGGPVARAGGPRQRDDLLILGVERFGHGSRLPTSRRSDLVSSTVPDMSGGAIPPCTSASTVPPVPATTTCISYG